MALTALFFLSQTCGCFSCSFESGFCVFCVSIKTKRDSAGIDDDKDTETTTHVETQSVSYIDCPDYDFSQKDTIGEMERELEEMIRANYLKP